MRPSLVAVLAVVVLSGACAPEVREGGGGDAPPRADADPSAPAEACLAMDLLFVIDDSDSMREEQVNLTASFPGFAGAIDGFRTASGGALDYRVAVTTTGVDLSGVVFGYETEYSSGPDGAFVAVPGLDRPWIERADEDVAARFSAIADVGIAGSVMEMPLRAVELALSARIADGANAGFLREDALLGVVVLSDEDDCSYGVARADIDPFDETGGCGPGSPGLTDPAALATFLDGVKGGRDRWAATVIAGPPPVRCESTFGMAAPGTRLATFVDAAGPQAVFSSICDGDLAASLADALATFDAACRAFPID